MKIEKKIKQLVVLAALSGLGMQLQAQHKKIWASGMARSIFQQNKITTEGDTVTPVITNSGHALVDLTLNASPNENTYLNAMVRVRNDFGGFWGSGVTFDLRQLYLKGLIKNAVRYQLGDINYKLTPFTFYSNSEEFSGQQNAILDVFRQTVHQDWFYTKDNTWRQQGAALDFSLAFNNKFIQGADVDLFSTRVHPTDFAKQSERFFYGGRTTFYHKDKLRFGLNYVELADIKGTANNSNWFKNSVVTGIVDGELKKARHDYGFKSEFGSSKMSIAGGTDAGDIRDYFFKVGAHMTLAKRNVALHANYINVGPGFRSVGAQSKRVNFEAMNLLYGRYMNAQNVRAITSLDMAQDASLYRNNFNPDLDNFLPWFDNIRPYGEATPNRKGLDIKVVYSTESKKVQLSGNLLVQSEVVGQGIESLRQFTGSKVDLNVDMAKILGWKKRDFTLSASHGLQRTSRSSDIVQSNIDLSSSVADIGLQWEFAQDFDLILTYRNLTGKGNEYWNQRNELTQIVDFKPLTVDLKETILMAGIRYRFSDKNQIQALWQKMNWSDKAGTLQPFSMEQIAIVYILNF